MEKLTQILNDPEQMQQISQIASVIGMPSPENPQSFPVEIPESITSALETVQRKGEKQQALVRALLPYLSPTHQKKLEQAIKIAQLSQWAGATMQAGVPQPLKKEVTHDL